MNPLQLDLQDEPVTTLDQQGEPGLQLDLQGKTHYNWTYRVNLLQLDLQGKPGLQLDLQGEPVTTGPTG